MIGQGKSGWVIAGICGAIVLTSFGYGMGRRAALKSVASSMNVAPAGSPLPAIQIEPIQPQEEFAAINNSTSSASTASQPAETGSSVPAENAATPAASAATAAASAKTETAAAGTTEESGRVREIQLALRAAGFDPGSSDGRLGPRTKTAVRDFQQAHGLNPDGKVGPRTWAKLETYLKTAKNSAPTPGSAAAAPTSAQGD